MKFFLPIIVLLSISGSVLGKGIPKERSNNEDELSYQELRNLNVSCYPWDSCTEDRTDDSPVPGYGDKCSCHSQCWEYGTCCIDSPYRFKPPIQKCLRSDLHAYYMVYRCPDNTHPDSIWRSNCEKELGEVDSVDEIDDILLFSPVTSQDTLRTYRNYYCFRCHETTDKYVSWNLEVEGYDVEDPSEVTIYSVAYNQTEKIWVAILDESHTSFHAYLSFLFPDNVQGEPIGCIDVGVISDCPGWVDERLHSKCLAYSTVVYSKFTRYKNVHCALCNNVSLDNLTCDGESYNEGGGFVHQTSAEHAGGAGYGKTAGGAVVSRGPNYSSVVRRCSKNCIGKGDCLKKDDRPETCKGEFDVWNCISNKCKKLN